MSRGSYTVTGNERAITARASAERGQPAAASGHLKQHIAGGGRFNRPGHDRNPAGVGGELTEQGVATAAAHDMKRLDRRLKCRFQTSDCPSILQCEAFQRAPDKTPFVRGRGLAGLLAKGASRAGMSPGKRNEEWSGSTSDANGDAPCAAATSSS